ncbi:hypothetical protein C0585_00350 [Candidatus Woesearchaeota archaeon]|nr:MAG: hypothetical protein C0585_00350 [Candidatus Woesearchaeota archaeon]
MNLKIRNKKAMGWTLIWIINFFVVIVSILVITGIVTGTINKQIETKNLRAQILAKRLIYNPECLAYYDSSNQRTEIGTIDKSKLNDLTISNCYGGDDTIGIKITIGTKEYYLNKNIYRDIAPIAFSGQYQRYNEKFFIKTYSGSTIDFEYVNIDLVMDK